MRDKLRSVVMSVRQSLAGNGVTPDGNGRFAKLRAHKRTLIIIGAVIISALTIYAVFIATQYSESEELAITESETSAKGFDTDTPGYTLRKLNRAVTFAYENKCDEARAVYETASKSPNGLKESDISAYGKRIEDICSGKEPTANPDQN